MSLNKVMLIGNVGRDPEVRYLDSNAPAGQGRKVATFTLATSEKYRDRNGELRENTEWHNIVAWGNNADTAEKYIKKGSQLYIEGRIRTRSWVDQSGIKKYTTEISTDSIQLLGRRESSEGGYSGSYQNSAPQAAYQAQQQSYQAPVQPDVYQAPAPTPAPAPIAADESDDLPF